MPSIGTLVGFLRLDDAQYQRALKAAQSQTRAFASGVTSQFTRILGPAALAGSLIALGKRALDTADRFDDLATRINASFEGVQVLEHLAKDFGNSAEIFTQAGDRIQQAIAEAASGNLKAAGTFRELGVSVEQLSGLKLEQQLEILAKAVVNATDQQRAFLTLTEILGTKATPQLKAALIALGTEGYAALADRTKESVGIMSAETGKRLAESKRTIEDFVDSLTILGAEAIDGWQQILNPDAGLDKFEKAMKRFSEALETPGKSKMFGIALPDKDNVAREAADMAAVVIAAGERATEAQLVLSRGALEIARQFLDERGSLSEAKAAHLLDLETKLTEQIEALAARRAAAEKAAAAVRGAVAPATPSSPATPPPTGATPPAATPSVRLVNLDTSFARTAAEELELRILKLNEALAQGTLSPEAYERALEDLADGARTVRTPLEQYGIALRALDRARADGVISQEAYVQELAKLKATASGVQAPLDTLAERIRVLDDALGAGFINQQEYNEELRRAQEAATGASDPIAGYKERVKQLDTLLASGAITQRQYNLALAEAKQAAGGVLSPLETFREQVRLLKEQQAAGIITAQQYNKALRDAQNALLPPGSKGRGNRGPTPPNPAGSGMTNEQWKQFYQQNPEAGDGFRESRPRPTNPSQDRWEEWQRGGGRAGPTPQAVPPTMPPPGVRMPEAPVVPDTAPKEASANAETTLVSELKSLVTELKTISGKLVVG